MTAGPYPAHSDAYIDLIKRTVTNYSYLGGDGSFKDFRCVKHYDVARGQWTIDPFARPLTLLRKSQLDLVERCLLDVEARGIPGDCIEAGVWRGGVIVLLRALLKAYRIESRRVFAADSFAGIPKNTRARNDPVDFWPDRWAASLDEVRANIARFALLDERIVFVAGLFSETLKTLASERFALIRLDSDSYDSVEESLVFLYPLLSPGGVVIIDDWHLAGSRAAVLNYRARHGVEEEIKTCDGNAYWIKR